MAVITEVTVGSNAATVLLKVNELVVQTNLNTAAIAADSARTLKLERMEGISELAAEAVVVPVTDATTFTATDHSGVNYKFTQPSFIHQGTLYTSAEVIASGSGALKNALVNAQYNGATFVPGLVAIVA